MITSCRVVRAHSWFCVSLSVYEDRILTLHMCVLYVCVFALEPAFEKDMSLHLKQT